MTEIRTIPWHEANQRYLTAALRQVRTRLEHTGAPLDEPASAMDRAAAMLSAPSGLDQVCTTFGLSDFERYVLLLCAGIELDATFPTLCAAASGHPERTYPTFALALATFPDAHWSALPPSAALRHWRLVDVDAGPSLVTSRLRIDERILHVLTGTPHQDAHLAGFVQPLAISEADLVPSHRATAETIAALWQTSRPGELPVIQLCGSAVASKRAIASAACMALGLGLSTMPAEVLPSGPHEFDVLIRLWERESALTGRALLLELEDAAAMGARMDRFAEVVRGPLLIALKERRRGQHRTAVAYDVGRPTMEEQRERWTTRLGSAAHVLNGQIDQLAAQFDLSAPAIDAACLHAQAHRPAQRATDNVLADRLWEACRMQARPKLDDLARRLEPVATWDDLVLPEPQRRTLNEIALQIRQRARVYGTWGFAASSQRGLGISALFYGASGTGKTMAAEVLANDLRLDLYHIDLSQVVSKYIGETEKNLGRVFDAAEEGGAVLLFDEADALFGKRTDVKDSHDRYANIEVSYLLQRMEAYRGLAVLTTNMKGAIDDAFLRRIRFTVAFPFPQASQRADIWRRIFPAATPTEGLQPERLAQLNVTGGNIRNIALGAAFLAADANEPIRMAHLLHAARSEYAKLEKPLTDLETRGWL